MKVGEAFVEIRPDTHGFQAEAERGVGGSIKKLAGLAAGAFAGVAVAGFLRDSIAEAQEAAKVTAQTSAVIKSTGAAAHVTAGQVSEFAESLSRKTAIDDEAIQSGQNMLLTFTNIRNEAGKGNDIFNQASSAIVDLSVAMGTDAKGAAIQVGKALNDPIKGITALTRVGVTFTDQQKEQIKSMVAAGDTMGAQKVILAELNKEFGGSAAAQATPLDKLKVAWANLKEEVGTKVLAALAPVATFLAEKIPGALDAAGRGFDRIKQAVEPVITQVKRVVGIFASAFADPDITSNGWVGVIERVAMVARHFADFVSGNLKPILAALGVIVLTMVVPPFVAWAVATIAATLPFVALAAAVLGAIALVQRFPVILDVLKAAMAAVGAAFQSVAGFFVSLWPQISEAFSHGVNTIVGIVRPFIALIVGAWRLFGDDILVIVRAAWGYVQATIQNALAVIQNVIRLVLAIINGDWGKAWDALKGIVGAFVSQIQAALRAGLGLLRGIFGAAFDAARAAVVASVGGIVSYVAGIPARIVGALGNLGNLLVHAGEALMDGLRDGIVAGFKKVAGYVGGLGKKIASLKGPLDYDRKLLVPNAHAIMQGLYEGLVARLAPLLAMVRTIGPAIAAQAAKTMPKLEDQPGWDWATQGNKSRGVLIGGRMYTQHADGTITDDHPFADNQAFIQGAIRKGVAQLPDSALQAGRADVGARTVILQWVVNGKIFAEETIDVFADALRRRDQALV